MTVEDTCRRMGCGSSRSDGGRPGTGVRELASGGARKKATTWGDRGPR